jgi:hypothetical protein
MDDSTIPKDFLELYPYPALVLVVPIPPSEAEVHTDPDDPLVPPELHHFPFTRSAQSASSTFDPVWANEKWRNLMQGQRLLDSISISTARELGNWVAGSSKVLRKTASRRGSANIPRAPHMRPAQPPAVPQRPALADGLSEMQVEQALGSPTPSGSKTAPEGFWEPEIRYEDRTTSSDHTLSESGLTGIEDADHDTAGPATITIELVEPGHVKLELTQTQAPIYHYGRTGARTQLQSHTFVIITSVPRSEFVSNRSGSLAGESVTPAPLWHKNRSIPASRDEMVIPDTSMFLTPQAFMPTLPRTTILPAPSEPHAQNTMIPQSATGNGSRDLQITPTDEIMALDLSASGERTDRPLLFDKDGVVSRLKGSRTAGCDERGKALDVNVLLETYDWATTSLGPKDRWPQSLKTVGE